MLIVRASEKSRIVMKTAQSLLEEGIAQEDEEGGKTKNPTYTGGKWGGLYLRAPDIYFRVLEKGKDKLVRLGDVAEVRRGFTTGANDFFYLEILSSRPTCPLCNRVHEDEDLVPVKNGLEWEGYLEKSVLKPLFKSPKDSRSLQIPVENLDLVFLPDTPDFKKLPLHAQHYVRYGEELTIVVKKGAKKGTALRGIPSLSTVKGRTPWWWLGEWPEVQVVVPMFERSRKYVFWSPDWVAVDNALYLVLPRSKIDPLALFLTLNSTLFGFFKELLARPPEGGGGGPLQMKVYDYEAMPLPPLSPPPALGKDLLETFMNRTIPDFWEEVGLRPPDFKGTPNPPPDRRALDDHFFNLLGLTEEERNEVYRETARLVWNRIALAKSLDEANAVDTAEEQEV